MLLQAPLPTKNILFFCVLQEEHDTVKLNYADSLLPTCLLQNLRQLWASGTLCDVVLVAEGREIAAHRVVLAAASSYFR